MITDAELAAMREAIAATFPDTCNVLSPTTTSDGQGGWSQTWGTATAGVACRLDQKTGFETMTGGARQAYSYWVVTLPYDTTVTPEYRLEIGRKAYSVVDVDGDKSWAACVRCKVDEI